MLELVDGAKPEDDKIDWPAMWDTSTEAQGVHEEISRIHYNSHHVDSSTDGKESHTEFATHLWVQIYQVTYRALQQNYRTPEYIYSKLVLGIVSALFIGFSFWMPNGTQQGFQNVLFSLFLLCTIFGALVNQLASPHV